MNIIVEGCDGVGKDTLISNLVKLTGKKVIRGSSFEISQLGSDGMFEFSKKLLLDNDDAIFNRFFYSNAVYGKLFDYPTMTDEQFTELNRLAEERATVYYLKASTETIVNRLENRGDDMVRPEHVRDIQVQYKDIWSKYTPSTLVEIDTENDSILDTRSEIYQTIMKNDFDMRKIDNGFEKK